jgi:hypothetical protein
MIDKTIIRKLFKNKRNNQISITLPRELFVKWKEGKATKINPKKARIRIEEFYDD